MQTSPRSWIVHQTSGPVLFPPRSRPTYAPGPLQALSSGVVVVHKGNLCADALRAAQSDAECVQAPGTSEHQIFICVDGWKNVAQAPNNQAMQVTVLAPRHTAEENRKFSILDIMSLAAQSTEVKGNMRVPSMTEQVQHAWLVTETLLSNERTRAEYERLHPRTLVARGVRAKRDRDQKDVSFPKRLRGDCKR